MILDPMKIRVFVPKRRETLRQNKCLVLKAAQKDAMIGISISYLTKDAKNLRNAAISMDVM